MAPEADAIPDSNMHMNSIFGALALMLGSMALSLDGAFWGAVTIVSLTIGSLLLFVAATQAIRSAARRRTRGMPGTVTEARRAVSTSD